MKKLEELSTEEREKFEDRVINNLYNRGWCRDNKINYINPDIKKAREITYKEVFGEYNP